MNRLWLILTLCSLHACSDQRFLTLPETNIDNPVFAVALLSEGRVVGTGRVTREDSLTLEQAGADHAVFWVLDADSFRDASGRALTPEALAEIDVLTDNAEFRGPSGSCGRCLVPSHTPLQRVSDGDLCPLRPGLERHAIEIATGDRADAEVADAIEAEIRLAWPGTCACGGGVPETQVQNAFEVCSLAPEDAPWVFGRNEVGLARGGWMALLQGSASVFIGPDAERVVRAPGRDEGEVGHVIPLRTSTTTRGEFLVTRSVENGGSDRRLDFIRVEDGTTQVEEGVVPDGAMMRVHEATVLPDAAVETVMFFGWARGVANITEPAISEITHANGRFTGQRMPLDPNCRLPGLADLEARHGTVLPNGTGLAFLDDGYALFKPANERRWYCGPESTRDLRDGTTNYQLIEAPHVRQIDNVAFVCGLAQTDAGQPRSIVARADVAALSRTGGSFDNLPEFRVLHAEAQGIGCTDLETLGGGRVRVVLGASNPAIDFDVSGQIVREYTALSGRVGAAFEQVTQGSEYLYSSPDGFHALLTHGREVHRQRPGATMERVYGPSEASFSVRETGRVKANAAIAVEDEGRRAVAFRGDLPPIVATEGAGADCSRFSIETRPVDQVHGTERVSQVALALGDERYLVLERLDGTQTARWYDLSTGVLEREAALPAGAREIRYVAQLDSETIVALEFGTGIYEISEGEVRALNVLWDDPETVTVEAEPQQLVTIEPDENPRPRWRAIDAKNGVAWAVGNGLMARVFREHDGQPLRAEGYWSTRLERSPLGEFRRVHTQGGEPASYAHRTIELMCSDSALITGVEWKAELEDQFDGQPLLSAWELGPSDTCASSHEGALTVCPYNLFSAGQSPTQRPPRDGGVLSFISDRGPRLLLAGGTIANDPSDVELGYRLTAGAFENERVWYIGIFDRLGFAREQ